MRMFLMYFTYITLQMVERIEDAIVSLESKMASKLDRIEEHLDCLEAVSNSPADVPSEIVSASL